MKKFYDGAGNEVKFGDIIKVFHFIYYKGKRQYMYKRVGRKFNNDRFKVYHLCSKGWYTETDFSNCVVVQRRNFNEKDWDLKKHKIFGN